MLDHHSCGETVGVPFNQGTPVSVITDFIAEDFVAGPFVPLMIILIIVPQLMEKRMDHIHFEIARICPMVEGIDVDMVFLAPVLPCRKPFIHFFNMCYIFELMFQCPDAEFPETVENQHFALMIIVMEYLDAGIQFLLADSRCF